MTDERKTFTVPDGYEAVRDADGRATGEVRPTHSSSGRDALRQHISTERAAWDHTFGGKLGIFFNNDELELLETVLASSPTPQIAGGVRVDLLSRARQFVSDGGCDEDDMDVHLARVELLEEIDAALSPQAQAGEPPFYGAECPSYPACEGGCGLGCTKEIERSRAVAQASTWQPIETAPNSDDFRFYGLYVTNNKTGSRWFEAHYLSCNDDGQLVLSSGDNFDDWAYSDFEYWAPGPSLPSTEGK